MLRVLLKRKPKLSQLLFAWKLWVLRQQRIRISTGNELTRTDVLIMMDISPVQIIKVNTFIKWEGLVVLQFVIKEKVQMSVQTDRTSSRHASYISFQSVNIKLRVFNLLFIVFNYDSKIMLIDKRVVGLYYVICYSTCYLMKSQ